jgi:hypothetical protein
VNYLCTYNVILSLKYHNILIIKRGRDSSVGIANVYGWTVRESNPCRGDIFSTRPDRPWGPPSHLYNGYRVFPGCKAARAWRWPPTPSSAEVNKRIGFYLYFTSGPSWPVIGWTLPVLYNEKFTNAIFYKSVPSLECSGGWPPSAGSNTVLIKLISIPNSEYYY